MACYSGLIVTIRTQAKVEISGMFQDMSFQLHVSTVNNKPNLHTNKTMESYLLSWENKQFPFPYTQCRHRALSEETFHLARGVYPEIFPE